MSASLSRRPAAKHGRVWRERCAVGLPAAVPLTMAVVFRCSQRRLGPVRGYQMGFLVYWGTCWAMSALVLGRQGLANAFRPSADQLPDRRALSALLLVVPPLGAVTTQWWPNLRATGPAAAVLAAAVGTTNAVSEEVLWRGIPVAVFADDPVRGWIWPALGFTGWHLVPARAGEATASRTWRLLGGAALIGFGYGWIAFRTRSLALVAPAHAITDSSGLLPVRARWSSRSG